MRWGLLYRNRVIATAEDTAMGRDMMNGCLRMLQRSRRYTFGPGLRVAREETPGVFPRWAEPGAPPPEPPVLGHPSTAGPVRRRVRS